MTKRLFAIVIDNEVIGTLGAQENGPKGSNEAIEAYSSDPIVIQTPNDSVVAGWTWDGTNFYPPVEGQ